MTNTIIVLATKAMLALTAKYIESPEFPTHDAETGIGQATCVQYTGATNDAPSRTCGIVVSRIVTDPTDGEKWCLVEFGDGPPWKPYALNVLAPTPVSVALRGFPAAGMETVKAMLREARPKPIGRQRYVGLSATVSIACSVCADGSRCLPTVDRMDTSCIYAACPKCHSYMKIKRADSEAPYTVDEVTGHGFDLSLEATE